MKTKITLLVALFAIVLFGGSFMLRNSFKNVADKSAGASDDLLKTTNPLSSDDVDLPREKSTFIHVFPNPADNEANIVLNSKEEMSDVSLSVIDFSGKTNLVKVIAKIDKGDNYVLIDTKEFKTGVYIITGDKSDGLNLGKLKLIIRH